MLTREEQRFPPDDDKAALAGQRPLLPSHNDDDATAPRTCEEPPALSIGWGSQSWSLSHFSFNVLLIFVVTLLLGSMVTDANWSGRNRVPASLTGQNWGDRIIEWVQTSPVASLDAIENKACPQVDPWKAGSDAQLDIPLPESDVLAERLGGSVRIDTSVHDSEPSPEEDPEPWTQRFEPFRDYLRSTFPSTHSDQGPVSLELVHKHGLLYTWKGSDEARKPILFMAHQDVVPVDSETIDSWLYPPFSGAIANESVWGRGSVDAKSWVISILSSVEALIDAGFQPKRTILVSFGYDEEANGRFGGRYLGERVEEIYGKDSIAMIVDEGNPVVPATEPLGLGLPIAIPAVEEKGNVHVNIRMEAQGGHSSRPPPRTTVGLLSELVAKLETEFNLKAPVIPDLESAHLKTLQCARDSPAVPQPIRQALKNLDWASRSSTDDLLALGGLSMLQRGVIHLLALTGPTSDRRKQHRIERAKRALLAVLPDELKGPWRTTQTPTMFHGGIKLNAIPPSAQVDIDHRVALHHSVDYLRDWYWSTAKYFARTHNLALTAFGENVTIGPLSYGCHKADAFTTPPVAHMFVDTVGPSLPPAPRTPLSGPEAEPWRILQSVIRSTWTVNTPGEDGSASSSPLLVAPAQMSGNTDTRWYWNVTRHIFRFGPNSLLPDPIGQSAWTGVHGVNEHYRIDGLAKATVFYRDLIRAVDVAEGV